MAVVLGSGRERDKRGKRNVDAQRRTQGWSRLGVRLRLRPRKKGPFVLGPNYYLLGLGLGPGQ